MYPVMFFPPKQQFNPSLLPLPHTALPLTMVGGFNMKILAPRHPQGKGFVKAHGK